MRVRIPTNCLQDKTVAYATTVQDAQGNSSCAEECIEEYLQAFSRIQWERGVMREEGVVVVLVVVVVVVVVVVHRDSKKGATLTMAVALSILDRFAKFFHCCKEH